MSVFSFNQQTGYLSLLKHPIDSGFIATTTQLITLIEQSQYCDFEIIAVNISKLFEEIGI